MLTRDQVVGILLWVRYQAGWCQIQDVWRLEGEGMEMEPYFMIRMDDGSLVKVTLEWIPPMTDAELHKAFSELIEDEPETFDS